MYRSLTDENDKLSFVVGKKKVITSLLRSLVVDLFG